MPTIQTGLVNKGLQSYFEKDSVDVSVSSLNFTPFTSLEVKELLLSDTRGDTFIYVGKLLLGFGNINFEENNFELDSLKLSNGKFHLVHYKGEKFVNIRFLLDHFSPSDTSSSKQFSWIGKSVELDNIDFVFKNENKNSGIQGMDFDDIHVENLHAKFSNLKVVNGDMETRIDQFSLNEKSGFTLDSLKSDFKMTPDSMSFQNLKIVTPNSIINGQYTMLHGAYAYYSQYITKVVMKGELHDISLNFKDVIYFSDNLIGFDEYFSGSASFNGTVSDFVASNVNIKFRNQSVIKGKVAMKGIPEMDSTVMHIELVNSKLHPEDVDALLLETFSDNLKINLPEYVNNLEKSTVSGTLDGYYYNFNSKLYLQSPHGNLNADFNLEKKKDLEYYYSGKVSSKNLNLGHLFETDYVQQITATLSVVGKGFSINTLSAEVSGDVDNLGVKGYNYSNTKIDGKFYSQIFQGDIVMKDPNCNFDFLGTIDLTENEPRYAFVSNVNALYPSKLHFLDRDTSSFIHASINIDAKGNDVENFAGKFEVSDLIYKEKGKEIKIPNIKFRAFQVNERRQMELKSSIGKGTLSGSYDIPRIGVYFKNMLRNSVPSFVQDVPAEPVAGDFKFSINMYNLNPILEIFYPALELDSNFKCSGEIDGANSEIDIELTTDGFTFGGAEFDTLAFFFTHENKSILSQIKINSLSLHKDISYKDIYLEAVGINDSISVIVRNDNQSVPEFKSDISFNGILLGPKSMRFSFDSSYVVLADSVWTLNTKNRIEIDSSRWDFQNFRLVSNLKKIQLSGAISKDTNDSFDMMLTGLNLGNFAKIAGIEEAQLDGNVTGNVTLSKLYYRPEITSSIYVDDLYANGEYIGSGPIKSSWNQSQKRFDVNFELFRPADSAFIDTIRSLKFHGHYYPQVEDTSFHLKLLTDGFKLKALEPIVKEYVDNISGELIGELDLTGSFNRPIVNGEVRLDSTRFRIDYLNTTYTAHDQKLIFRDDWFGFNNLSLQDENGRKARSVGTINHDNWKNYNYDVYVRLDTFLALNTNVKQNDLFYGTAFLTGDVDIAGYEEQLIIEMDARAQNQSKLFIPFYAANEVSSNEFIHFVSLKPDEDLAAEESKKTDLSGIDLKLNFNIDPSTEIQLIFDETSGEKISAQGGGALKMLVNEESDFEMYGIYEIRNGDYFFNFENIISKRFTLQQGGRIEFNGDPLNARMDVVAQYKVKARLQEILGDSSYSQKVENLCLMHLTDQLSEPNIGFDIKVLNVDADIESRVKSQMPTQEDVNKQVFSLMLFNKYSPPENSMSGSGFAGTTTSELLTSQINSWLSKMDNDVINVGVSELKQDNVEVELSKQMMDNRLIFESNLGVDNSQNNANQGQSGQFVGDFKLEYMVTEDGKVRAKVFNRSETYRIEDQGNSASQTQGIGIFFQEDFESYGQLFKKYFNNPEKKKIRHQKKEAKRNEKQQ